MAEKFKHAWKHGTFWQALWSSIVTSIPCVRCRKLHKYTTLCIKMSTLKELRESQVPRKVLDSLYCDNWGRTFICSWTKNGSYRVSQTKEPLENFHKIKSTNTFYIQFTSVLHHIIEHIWLNFPSNQPTIWVMPLYNVIHSKNTSEGNPG